MKLNTRQFPYISTRWCCIHTILFISFFLSFLNKEKTIFPTPLNLLNLILFSLGPPPPYNYDYEMYPPSLHPPPYTPAQSQPANYSPPPPYPGCTNKWIPPGGTQRKLEICRYVVGFILKVIQCNIQQYKSSHREISTCLLVDRYHTKLLILTQLCTWKASCHFKGEDHCCLHGGNHIPGEVKSRLSLSRSLSHTRTHFILNYAINWCEGSHLAHQQRFCP